MAALDACWSGTKTHLQQELIGTAVPHLDLGRVVSQLSLVSSQILDMPRLLVGHLRRAEAGCGSRGQDWGSARALACCGCTAEGCWTSCRLQQAPEGKA